MKTPDTFELASVKLFEALVALHFDCASQRKEAWLPGTYNTGHSIAHTHELETNPQ